MTSDLGFVVSFAGAVFGSAIIYVFPSIMYITEMRRRIAKGMPSAALVLCAHAALPPRARRVAPAGLLACSAYPWHGYHHWACVRWFAETSARVRARAQGRR